MFNHKKNSLGWLAYEILVWKMSSEHLIYRHCTKDRIWMWDSMSNKIHMYRNKINVLYVCAREKLYWYLIRMWGVGLLATGVSLAIVHPGTKRVRIRSLGSDPIRVPPLQKNSGRPNTSTYFLFFFVAIFNFITLFFVVNDCVLTINMNHD